jgi:RNA polymerase sigma-70 factor (ECF subfamily)
LKRITINKCINALKKRKADLIPVETLPDKYEDDKMDEDVQGLSVEKVQLAMKQLPEGYRVIFSLYLLEGYDHAEISGIMGISEATSKSQYSRAKQRMKEIILNQQYERQV